MKKNKKFDLSRVSGGLSVGGAVIAKGDVTAVDRSEVIKSKLDNRNITETKTGVDIGIKVDYDGSKGLGDLAKGLANRGQEKLG